MSVEEAIAPADATCERLVAALRAELGDKVLAAEIQRTEIIARVAADDWVAAARACRDKLDMNYFCFLSGLDWLDNPDQTTRYENIWGSVEDEEPFEDADADEAAAVDEAADAAAEEDHPADAASGEGAVLRTGLAGGGSRFQVFARFASTTNHRGITVKADLDEAEPRVATLIGVYAGTDWHERETWEMYGFDFVGHPHLVHIYLPTGFEGFPQRKDFPLLAREVKPWPGLTNVEPIAEEQPALAESEVGS